MTTPLKLAALAVCLSTVNAHLSTLHAQGTAFTYQGQMNDGANPAAGIYDLRFAIYDAAGGGTPQGVAITNTATAVSNGLFTATLDFGSQFPGANRWLEIAVRTNGGGAFFTLAPRQALTPAPYAITAGRVVSGGLSAGTYSSALTLNNPGNSFAGTFTGNGANVTNVNAAALNGLTSAGFWKTNGNAGAGGAFLGTTDNQPVEVKVNGQRALRLLPASHSVALSPNLVVGDSGNVLAGSASGAGILGGWDQFTDFGASGSVIGGGHSNRIGNNASFGVISGGERNALGLGAGHSVVAGGRGNSLESGAFASSILGGSDNRISATLGNVVIAGGSRNSVTGQLHTASIGGGRDNLIGLSGFGAAIPGGSENYAGGANSLAAGFRARAEHDETFVWADGPANGFTSTGAGQFLVKAGGGVGINTNNPDGAALAVNGNSALSGKLLVSGNVGIGVSNPATALHVQSSSNECEISLQSGDTGGRRWTLQSSGTSADPQLDRSFQIIDRSFSRRMLLLGQSGNVALGPFARAQGNYSTAAGYFTTASGGSSTALGNNTTASGSSSTALGNGSTASGDSATSMGYFTTASGAAASALGAYAEATHNNTFVWADGSSSAAYSSTTSNQFNLRAAGGVRLSDNTPGIAFGSTLRQMLNLWSTNYGIGVQASSLYFRCNDAGASDGFIWYRGGAHNDAYANAGGGSELMHLVSGALYVNGTLVSTSDRNAKENFQPVDAKKVLEKVVALPLSEWNYKVDPSQRHLGPVAQDFHAAFGVGPDDKHIATVDADGVALAAIQGLNQKLEEQLRHKDAELQSQQRQIGVLLERLATIEAKLQCSETK